MKNNHSSSIYKRTFLSFFLLISASLLSVTSFAKDNAVKQKINLDFSVIPMHYGLLNAEPWTWGEAKGLIEYEVSSDVSAGDDQITLNGHVLHESELFVYLSYSGKYHVAQVKSKDDNTYHLEDQIRGGISAGPNVWNFYENGSHPNTAGHKAIADFAIEHLNTANIENKKHVFIGDSWFAEGTFIDRFSSQIAGSHVINKAVHGRTSSEALLAFDTDLSNVDSPDFIWVSLGTNDYWNRPIITSHEYIKNIENIILKVNTLGAKAIVIDASVGIYDDGTSQPKARSDNYANALHTLKNNSKSSAGSLHIIDLFSLLALWSFFAFARKKTNLRKL